MSTLTQKALTKAIELFKRTLLENSSTVSSCFKHKRSAQSLCLECAQGAEKNWNTHPRNIMSTP